MIITWAGAWPIWGFTAMPAVIPPRPPRSCPDLEVCWPPPGFARWIVFISVSTSYMLVAIFCMSRQISWRLPVPLFGVMAMCIVNGTHFGIMDVPHIQLLGAYYIFGQRYNRLIYKIF